LSQAQDSSLTHSTLQLRATMSAIRHPCLIMGQCPSNFEGRNSWGAEINMQSYFHDTQKMAQEGNSARMVQWLPKKHWEINSGGTDPEMLRQVVSLVDDYLIFLVIDAEAGVFGGINSKPRSEIMSNIRVVIEKGTELFPLQDEEMSSDLRNMLATIKPGLSNALGQFGEGLRIVVFKGKDSQGKRFISAEGTGRFSVILGDESFKWRLPLGSLLPPVIDQETGESFPGNYLYNPFTGNALK
ncbi:MAG: hypothetical protein BECKG1743E_GA0114224_111311, partial [Candidatus Kentron sp. G]